MVCDYFLVGSEVRMGGVELKNLLFAYLGTHQSSLMWLELSVHIIARYLESAEYITVEFLCFPLNLFAHFDLDSFS